jgi:TPP-dependent pyruvate/acetoin dehydrogenase alpha subunit
VGDINRSYYRPREEEEQWKNHRDPLRKLTTWLFAEGIADEKLVSQVEKAVDQEADEAVEFAKQTPYPAESEVTMHVYA